MAEVSILVVNYNGAAIIEQCLDSVLNQQNIDFEILVIDNASQDNSREVLDRYQDKIRCVYSEENLGFGRANNVLAKEAQGKWLYLLNPDASLTCPDDLQKLKAFMLDNGEVGLAGTGIQNNDGKPTKPRYHYHAEDALLESRQKLPGQVAWVLGASMFIETAAFKAIGGFDDDFFLYGEEIDLCMRMRTAGYQVGYCDRVLVKHIGGYSEAEETSYNTTIRKQSAQLLLYKKHYRPEAVKRILVKTWRRAKLRHFWHNLRANWCNKTYNSRRKGHYQAIIETTAAALDNNKVASKGNSYDV